MEITRSSVIVSLFVLLLLMEFSASNQYSNVSVIETERQALLNFKNTLTDPSNRLSSWVGEDFCTWRGVGCNQKAGHVVKLNLRNPYSFQTADWDDPSNYSRSCLGGEINPSLLELKYLDYLDLSLNNFTGLQIPKFFGSLKKLRYLNLSRAGFGGMVPHHLGNLSSLQYLDLNGDSMPDGFQNLTSDNLKWVSHISSLRHLDLSEMYIVDATDWLYEINMLPNLFELRLYHCGLRNIPHISYVNFTSLSILDLEWNRINSTIIPRWLFNLSSLVYLNLGDNLFRGSIPDAIGNMTSLTNLKLSDNEFEGEILKTVRNLCNLQSLMLSENKFSGEISVFLESSSGCLEKNLEILDLSYNEFSGPIPESLGQLPKLQVLGISSNSWEGTLSELHFAKLKRLKELYMSSNSLVLNLSSTWIPPFQLQTLDMRSCKLGPQFPPWLKTQRNISYLDMSNTSISVAIPDWFHDLSLRIDVLDLSYNQIRGNIQNFIKLGSRSMNKILVLSNNLFMGHIPQSISNTMPELRELYLSGNQLTGSIPVSLFKMKNLASLVLSNNNLSGQIPNSMGSNLRSLHLSGNQLTGSIPMSLCKMKNLESLDLSNNNLIGSIPMSLCKMKNLEYLVLSNNNLSGQIPNSMGSNLMSLDLSGNQLTGSIPVSLCKMEYLQILDLSKNNLSGQLPGCWNHSMLLNWIDLSNNKLSGHIPNSMGSLQSVRALYLNNNNFYGQLPSTLKKWTSLVILDLSENGFYGKIPPWIGDSFSWLESFSLRSNKFDGNIPQQICHLANLRLLDLSHNNISGSIPRCFGNLSSMKLMGKFDTENLSRFGSDHMSLIIKGRELEYTSNLPFVISLDLSSNNMVGGIPNELTDLRGLHNLNISGNHLTGKIPEKIGDLKSLESLDFSRNQLSGLIPTSMSSLTFLSQLNLSFNNLSGLIPMGNQLQTLEDPSIYVGNPELCGRPLQKNCTSDYLSNVHLPVGGGKSNDEADILWFYVGLGPGFACGFLAFCGILLFKKTWMYAYFGFFYKINNRLLVVVAVKMAKLKKLHRDEAGA